MQPSKVCAEELSPFAGQLRRDMQHWKPKSISSAMLHRVRSMRKDPGVRAMLLIINNTLFEIDPLDISKCGLRECGRHPLMWAQLADLIELLHQHKVPDVEFVLNVDDYPFIGRKNFKHSLPLFSLYQTREHMDILTPSGSFRQRNFDDLLQLSKTRLPWPQKKK